MEPRICTSCELEKTLDQFHRRGPGYQKICKECRNSEARVRHAKTGRSRTTTPSPINKDNVPALAEMVTSLASQLRAKANRFAGDGMEADDIYSVMVEQILTKSLPADSHALILQRANWAATDYVFKKQTHNLYAEPIEADDDRFQVASVEDEIIDNEISSELKAVIAQLPPEHRTVVSMLYIGMTQKEIAKILNVSETAISNRVKSIGVTMMKLGFSPA